MQKHLARMNGYSLIEMVLVILLATVSVPAIVSMYNTVLTNSHKGEIITVAEMLAVEQMETILADKAGTSVGFGYASIDNARYANVNPAAPFNAWTRAVDITTVDAGQPYEYKRITVTVSHSSIPPVELVTAVYNHPGL